MRYSKRHRGMSGFTLIESIATIAVLAVIASSVSFITVGSLDGYIDAAVTDQLHRESSSTMDRIVRELRKIDLDDTAGAVAPDVTSVTADSIAWEDDGGDAYSIALSGSQLMLAEDGAAAVVLADDVSAFSVATYDEDNTALAASLSGAGCDPIRRVSVEITMSRSGASTSLRTKVFIRATMAGNDEE